MIVTNTNDVPAGLKPVDVHLVIDRPIDEFRAGGKIYKGDCIKIVDGAAMRTSISYATHAAMNGAD